MEMKIKDLPLGTRFRYVEGGKLWVLLERHGHGLIAEWAGGVENCPRWPSGHPSQSICSIQDDNDIAANGPTMELVVDVNEEEN